MEAEQTDTNSEINPAHLEMFHNLISRFLAENCSGNCLDNDAERDEVAGKLAHFMLTPGQEVDMNPDVLLPKARYHLGFNIVDEPRAQRICRLILNRTPDMADGDFLQLQNFFWVTVGHAIVDNPEVRKTLEMAGVLVITEQPEEDPGTPAAL
jgi:hypothetical protein